MTSTPAPADPVPASPVPIVGQRRIFSFNAAGQPAYQEIDLTPADFLNPQPGDVFFHGDLHAQLVKRVGAYLRHHFRYSPSASVHLHTKLVWPDPILDQPMPDVAVINDLPDPHTPRPVIELGRDAPTARALFEVTSPLLATIDLTDKLARYARAAVPEVWILDTGLRPAQPTFNLGEAPPPPPGRVFNLGEAPPPVPRLAWLGYQLVNGVYQPIAQEPSGRWVSPACRLWITLSHDADTFLMGDMRTGRPFPPPAEDDDPTLSAQAEANRRAQSIADQLNL